MLPEDRRAVSNEKPFCVTLLLLQKKPLPGSHRVFILLDPLTISYSGLSNLITAPAGRRGSITGRQWRAAERKTKWAANDIQMILYPSHVYMEDMSSLWNEEWRWSFMWSLFWSSLLTWIYCKWMEVSLSLCCAVLSVYFPCISYIGFLSILEYTTQHFIL